MAPLPSRKSLEVMKRVDLQKLCKDYGVKANLKTEALIDLLLSARAPAPKPAVPQTTRRSVSARISSRTGPGRVSSVIIHDTDDEVEEDEEEQQDKSSDEQETENQPESEPEPPLAPQTRTRKAKDSQTRLGVGKPVAAGGAGPRAVTKSLSVSRGKRGKISRNMKLTEATIPEEPEPEASTESVQAAHNTPEPGPSSTNDESSQSKPDPGPPQNTTLASLADIDKYVADALRPLHEQMQSLKSEIDQMQHLKAELTQFKSHMADVGTLQQKVDNLTIEVEGLRSQVATATALSAEARELRGSVATTNFRQTAADATKWANPDTHFKSPAAKRTSSPTGFGNSPSDKAVVSTSRATDMNASGSNSSGSTVHGTSTINPTLPHPGIAPNMLGKRRRDSTASNVTGVVEEGQEDEFSEEELAKRVLRPTKKRPKIVQEGEELSQESASQPHRSEEEGDQEELRPGPRIPSFTVFSGEEQQEYLDPPPPTTHLPDFFAPPSPSGSGSGSSRQTATTSTAHASENQHPFSFSFLPLSSTPAHSMYPVTMPSFPYPEPPQSPSPAGSHQNAGAFLGHHDGERTDIFQAFGLPPPGRPRTGAALGAGAGSGSQDSMGGMGAFVNPAALTRPTDREREVSSNDVAAGLGLTSVRIASSSTDSGSVTGSDVPPMKRTMYGTELDGDTRFGDFGVEGVATGFWAGGRF